MPDPSLRADRAPSVIGPATLPRRDAPPPAAVIGRLPGAVGNRAIGRIINRSSGGGSAVPSGTAAERTLGALAPEVRVHQGVDISERPSALARADGLDIHLSPDAPKLGTAAGDFVLAHEAAHVVQHSLALNRTTSEGPHDQTEALSEHDAEAEADRAAESGGATRLRPAEGPHYFEARWHQATLANGMKDAGFTDEEASEAYFTNWCRDVSQAFVPTLVNALGAKTIMELLNTVAMLKFGKKVDPKLMGMYEPRQHIDNPAGQVSADLVQSDTPSIDVGTGQLTGKPDPALDPNADPAKGIQSKMKVDGSGVPAYINDSKKYIFEQVDEALKVGRSAEGMHAIGNFSHTIQDLFAHSNWVEMAVGKVIEDGSVKFPPAKPGDDTPEARLAKRIEDNKKQKLPIIENFSADVVDSAGQTRPILATGTFSGSFGMPGHDTMISLKAEVQNIIAEKNPFGPKGGGIGGSGWEVVVGILGAIDAAGQGGKIGDLLAGSFDGEIDGARKKAMQVLNDLPADAKKAVTDAKVFGVGLKDIPLVGPSASDVAGDAAKWGAGKVSGLAKTGVAELDGFITTMKTYVRKGVNGALKDMNLVGLATEAKSGYKALKEFTNDAKAWVNDNVPDILEPAAKFLIQAIENWQKSLEETVNHYLEKKWKEGGDWVLKQMESALAPGLTDVSESNVAQKLKHLKEGQKNDKGVEMTDEERKAKIEKLKASTIAAIKSANAGPKGEEAINRILNLPLPQALVYLGSAGFKQLMADLSSDAAGSSDELKSIIEAEVRIQQIEALPEWARQGASHSQIAKDHHNSPFFGLAFTLANTVDQKVLKLLMSAWSGMKVGSGAAPAAGLGGNYSYPNTPGSEGKSDAEQERARAFLDNRDMGKSALDNGQADELDFALALKKTAANIEKMLKDRAEDRTRRAKKDRKPAPGDTLSIGLAPLLSSIRKPDSPDGIKANLKFARDFVDKQSTGEDLTLSNKLKSNFDRIDRLAESLADAAKPGHHDDHDDHGGHDDHDDHDGHDHDKTEVFTKEQIAKLNTMRGKNATGPREHIDEKFKNAQQVKANDKRIDAITDPSVRLKEEIGRIFSHPYESNWWRDLVISWCNSHKEQLIEYIDERNQGVAHHH